MTHDSLSQGQIRRTQVLAWVVLAIGTLGFVAIALGIPLAALRFVRVSTVSEPASVEAKSGSVAIESASGMPVLLQGSEPKDVIEGTTISTDAASQAFVQFANGSTLSLEPNSRLRLLRLRRARFGLGDTVPSIRVYAEPLVGSEARLIAGSSWDEQEYTIVTPHGQIQLEPDARIRARVTGDALSVSANDGRAAVRTSGTSVTIGRDQRAEWSRARGLRGPMPAIEDRLRNGEFDDFAEPGSDEVPGWAFDRQPRTDDGDYEPGHAAQRTLGDGRSVLSFQRSGSGGDPGTLIYAQALDNLDVADSSFLGISATLRVVEQSLLGGGTMRTEFPVILNLIYESAGGDDYRWRTGLYARPPADDDPNRADLKRYDVLVPSGQWYDLDTGNLLDPANPFGFAQRELPAPVRLRRFEIVASGHDFESDIDRVGVWVK